MATVLQRDIYHQQVGLLNTAFSNRIIVILHILWLSLVLVKEQHSELSDIKYFFVPSRKHISFTDNSITVCFDAISK